MKKDGIVRHPGDNASFTEISLRIPQQVYQLMEELARYRGESFETMATEMLIEELDGELRNDDEMGQTIAKYLRQKYHFRKDGI